jgi:hypothetical protein
MTGNEAQPDLDMAMLIDAVSRREDPLARFLRALSDEMRAHAEETIRMRDELVMNTQRLLSSSNPREAAGYAAWIARHAHEVAYRWPALVSAYTRYAAYDFEPIAIGLRPPRAKEPDR